MASHPIPHPHPSQRGGLLWEVHAAEEGLEAGMVALADAMQYRTFPIPNSSRWQNLICPVTHLLVGRMAANSTKLDR